MTSLAIPEDFSKDLSGDRLSVIGELMLDVLAKAVIATSTPLDCAYSRGALSWAWIKNALLGLVGSQQYRWLSIRHAGNDLVIGIGEHPVRFFIDDHANPRKPRVLNPTDGEACQLSIDFKDQRDGVPVLWRFIVERALTDVDENRVFFVGYNTIGEIVAKWEFTDSVRTFRATDDDIPAAAQLDPVALAPIYEVIEAKPAGADNLNDNVGDTDERRAG